MLIVGIVTSILTHSSMIGSIIVGLVILALDSALSCSDQSILILSMSIVLAPQYI